MLINLTQKILFIMCGLFFAVTVSAQSEPANYHTVLANFTRLYNSSQPDSLLSLCSPEVKAGLPGSTIQQIKAKFGNLNKTEFISYQAPTAAYSASFDNASLVMTLTLNGQNQISGWFLKPAPVSEQQSSAAVPLDPSLEESPVTLKTFASTLSGTLTMPKAVPGKIPVVLIIAGSGPTDRNGNSLQMGLDGNTYKMLAYALGKQGIASLRYDKRLVGESKSTTKESELGIEDYVDDAVSLINMLHDDGRFSKVIVAGHSEGSLIGMMAAYSEPANAFISIAGAGEPAEKILTEQMKSQPTYIADEFKVIMDSLRKGKITENVDPAMYAIARPSVQHYLMSWCRYDPTREIRKLKIPILILQGTTDLQVSVDNAVKLKNAKSSATLIIIRGMNHILKDAPPDKAQNLATYSDPTLPLNSELVSAIVDFVKAQE